MGLNLDWSALAPGPAGTAMLGEGGIEGAARRGLERRRREALMAQEKAANDTTSEATLVCPSTQDTKVDAAAGLDSPAHNADKPTTSIDGLPIDDAEKPSSTESSSQRSLRDRWRALKSTWR
ncbi:predicted protein [Aspergillus terreus NIH2624]|uniref:Uncharacterized protein n=1 Tax=Aspergillus terreus (strain NIH 2624 / FGSC A1156) TaxID=341663 RepID=Q0CG86_ASPTN|nr:uncharacterized protein ATEG_07306 [Aspergillus terreus NIH2624]EAU32690.1 predicted protein [Aspergillus terreus NIH2624]